MQFIFIDEIFLRELIFHTFRLIFPRSNLIRVLIASPFLLIM